VSTLRTFLLSLPIVAIMVGCAAEGVPEEPEQSAPALEPANVEPLRGKGGAGGTLDGCLNQCDASWSTCVKSCSYGEGSSRCIEQCNFDLDFCRLICRG
jgi:hypothetical protein